MLFGYRQCGKSSAGNSILGIDQFEVNSVTASCMVNQAEVAGRLITVVEAPGYAGAFNDTPELTRKEMALSVSLCPPGPHAVLLVINAALSFPKKDCTEMEEHLKLLGEGVWGHAMVVFTFGDWLGHTSIEQVIESEDTFNLGLVEKCGNRYHVLDNTRKTNETQITELLEKIEEMVAGHNGHHYELDRKQLEVTQERNTMYEQRVKERQMKVEKERQHLQSLKSKSTRDFFSLL